VFAFHRNLSTKAGGMRGIRVKRFTPARCWLAYGNRIDIRLSEAELFPMLISTISSGDHNAPIWDLRDPGGFMGAAACIVVPSFWDRFRAEGDWQKLAWWIRDHLPYSSLCYFPRYSAFNISWHEQPGTADRQRH